MSQPDPGDDLVSITDIAEITGMARPTVSNWRRRHADFPQPKGKGTRGPLFSRAEVLLWLESREVVIDWPDDPSATSDPSERIWRIADTVPGLRYGTTPIDERLAVFFQALIPGTSAGEGRLFDDVRSAAAGLTDTQLAAAATYTLDRLGDTQRIAWFEPSGALASLMTALLGARAEVYDPASGLGRLLGSCATVDGSTPRIYAQALREPTALAATRYLRLLGVEADIRTGDTLIADQFADRQFDGIVTVPPLGTRTGEQLNPADPRWVLGRPSRNGEDAWIQHVLYHLAPGGRAVILVTPSFLFAEGVIADRRAQLVRNGYLRAALQLPARTLHGTAISPVLLVLERPAEHRPSPRVLVTEAQLNGPERDSWDDSQVADLVDTVTRWLNGKEPALGAQYAEVDVTELAADAFVLDPRRVLAPATVQARPLATIRHELNELAMASTAAAGALTQHIDALTTAIPTGPAASGPCVALGDLPGVTVTRGVIGSKSVEAGTFVLHTPRTLIDGQDPDRYLPEDSNLLRARAPSFNAVPGDLLIVLDGQRLGAVLKVTEKMFVSSHFAVIRATNASPDIEYLAQWLRSTQAQAELRRLTTGTTLVRVAVRDLRRIPVAVPDTAAQSEVGALGRYLTEAHSALQALQRHLAAIAELTAEATTAAIPADDSGNAR